ncbi:MAG: hypothetical protein ACI8RZ_004115 [Myxococcota bacterium]|jgi:hypothetical protein
MRLILAPLLLTALIGCTSGRHIRAGDSAAIGQDWESAYKSYERAAYARPGSAKAQQRLADARGEVMVLLDAQIAADLEARRFAAVGQLLAEASRYEPPRAWLNDHTVTTLAAVRADVAQRPPAEAHAVLSQCAVHHPLSVLAADRDRIGATWADDLRAQADQAAAQGDLGGALVRLSGARQLAEAPEDAAQASAWWAALRSEEWGGMHLSVAGPSAHRDAVSEALAECWATSPWSDAPIVSRTPDRPHLSAKLSITAAGCEQAQTGSEPREHRYTDGTFAANPRIQELSQQLRDNTRSLREVEAALSRSQSRLAQAQRQQDAAEAAVATAAPRLEGARRRDAETTRRLQAAQVEHAASLEAQAAIQEREREVTVLLGQQRERNTARRDLEQHVQPQKQIDLDAARQAREQVERDGAQAQATHSQLTAAISDAERVIAAAQTILDAAQPIQEAAAQAEAALPAHRSQLRAAVDARKEARAAHQNAVDAEEEATDHHQALLDAGDTPQADLDDARQQRVEAREAREATREALAAARSEAAHLQEGLATLETAIQRGAEQGASTCQAEADLTDARRDKDTAHAALPAAEADRAHARRELAEVDARLKHAEEAAGQVESQLNEIRRSDDDQARRLGQIESEISALSPSLSLLSARASTLSRAKRDRQDAARRLQEAEATMAPLLNTRQATQRKTAQCQADHRQRDADRSTHTQGLRNLEADLAATPAEVEVVKRHPYTVAHWQRTCTFTAAGSQARTAATSSDDATWTGFAYGNLSADPLRYTTEDAADLAASREAVIAVVWSDLSGQLLAQGSEARRRAADPTDLEAATRAWMLSDWLDPNHTDPTLAASIRARYPVPQ